MTGVLLLTSLISLFTTSFGVLGSNALLEVQTFSDKTRHDLINWRTKLQQPVIDVEATEVKSNSGEDPHENGNNPDKLISPSINEQ
jgi:hypothetical protein